MAIFSKGESDGCDRDDTVLNVTLCIDISGSMNSWLSQQNTHEVKKEKKNRLQLAVEAIKMFYSKLRSNYFWVDKFQSKCQIAYKTNEERGNKGRRALFNLEFFTSRWMRDNCRNFRDGQKQH